MSVNANTLAKKEHYYTVLAHNISELAHATAKYQGLMDKLVQQHKSISSMAVYHAAQFMAVSRIVDDEVEQAQEEAQNTTLGSD